MKILLDENIPIKFGILLGTELNVFSVRQQGWNGKKNGELLALMSENGFSIFVTLDKNLVHQNRIKNLPLIVIILNPKNSKILTLVPFIDNLKNILKSELRLGQTIMIDK